ncbi:hypothetical protein GCM10010271_11790 [Streptomyces kurssanovii]|nr:hypothetical protein GCM10010271_11790 [Streptomyces kurssanovii]
MPRHAPQGGEEYGTWTVADLRRRRPDPRRDGPLRRSHGRDGNERRGIPHEHGSLRLSTAENTAGIRETNMKYSRAAVILAGSVAALGVAAPAFAADSAGMPPMSLNGGLGEVVSYVPQMEDGTHAVTALDQVGDVATDLKNVKGKAPQQVLETAAADTPMLGGISLGG